MSRTVALAIGAALTIAMLVWTLSAYAALPAQVPTHWGLDGRIDDYGAKEWAAFIGVALMGLFTLLIVALPWLSPRSFAPEAFAPTFHYLMALCVTLFGYIQGVILLSALHHADYGRALIAGLLGFFALFGNVLGRTRRNFWIGVRTPWTLASPRVWDKTHRLAGRLMVGAGIFGCVLVAAGAPLWSAFVALIVALTIPVFYSLALYKRSERGA